MNRIAAIQARSRFIPEEHLVIAIDGVPPGTYELVAWHDRLGRVVERVAVAAGGTASVGVKMRAR